jgi:hypothetical protein
LRLSSVRLTALRRLVPVGGRTLLLPVGRRLTALRRLVPVRGRALLLLVGRRLTALRRLVSVRGRALLLLIGRRLGLGPIGSGIPLVLRLSALRLVGGRGLCLTGRRRGLRAGGGST